MKKTLVRSALVGLMMVGTFVVAPTSADAMGSCQTKVSGTVGYARCRSWNIWDIYAAVVVCKDGSSGAGPVKGVGYLNTWGDWSGMDCKGSGGVRSVRASY